MKKENETDCGTYEQQELLKEARDEIGLRV